MKFLPLFSLYLRHAYYSDSRCPDFQIEPAPDTQQLLNNYRCVLKFVPDGVQALISTTPEKQPFIPLQNDLKFNFYLRLQNPDFALFTDLAEFAGITEPVFTNGEAGDHAISSLTLMARQKMVHTMNHIFAEIEIHYDRSWPDLSNSPKIFQVVFKPKAARWKYYIVTDAGEARFQIKDQADNPVRFGRANQRDLTKTPDEADSVARMLADQYPAMQRLRFVSDKKAPRRQKPRTSLQLLLDGKKALESLPPPSFRNLSTVDVIKNDVPHQEDAWYQVVKYFKQQ